VTGFVLPSIVTWRDVTYQVSTFRNASQSIVRGAISHSFHYWPPIERTVESNIRWS